MDMIATQLNYGMRCSAIVVPEIANKLRYKNIIGEQKNASTL